MEKSPAGNKALKKRKKSIKGRFLLYSVILFVVILVGGTAAFIQSMRQIVHENNSNEMVQLAEIQRINLEASVNGEIAIALKMATSPLIVHYFQNPADPELEKTAFEEIAGYRQAFAANSVFWVNDRDKKFYSDDAYVVTLDVKDPNNYWYLMTLNETEKYNFNINYNPDLKVTNLWINAVVFGPNHKPIGIVGTGIQLTSFVDSIYKNYRGSASLYFFNEVGEITGAEDTKLVANKEAIDKKLGKVGPEILAWAKSHSTAKSRGTVTDPIGIFSVPEGEIVVGPIPALGWYVVVVQPLTIADYLNTSMTVLFLAMMALVVGLFILFNVSIRAFVRPLIGMIDVLNEISRDSDLMKRLKIQRNDEIGSLGDFFNSTFERFRELLYGIKGMAFALSDTGEELSVNMDETNSAIEKINANMQKMRGQVLSQGDQVTNTAGSMERIIEGLGKLNDHITLQANSVAQSSSAIEEMLANIRSVTETLVKNTANISSLAESSEAGRVDLQKVSADIQEIAKESEGLLEINSVMQNIASQTNLLSMNAAIEAAHAGESGKGFAVVADEIRKLAENSGQQSKTISQVLKKIKTSIDMITKSTAVVLERFGTIEKEVKTVSDQETQIRNAMEEQGDGSRQILEAITQLNSVTGLVKGASADMTTETNEALKESGNLKQITSEVAGSMDDMTGSVEQISNAVFRVKEISKENKESINELSGEIGKFKVN